MHGNAVTFCEPYGPRELVSMSYLCTLFQYIAFYWAFCQQKVLFGFYSSDEKLQCFLYYEFYYKTSQNWEQWYGSFSNVKIKNSMIKLETSIDLIKHGVSLKLDGFLKC